MKVAKLYNFNDIRIENIPHRFPIEKTAEAFRLTAEAKDSLKSVVVFE